MSSRGKRARGSHLVQPSLMHRSRQFLVDTQAIVTEQNIGYRPVFEDDHNAGHNPYSRKAMAQGTSHMDDNLMYENADIEQMYSHPKVDVGDSETQGVEDPHSGTTGATQGEQFEDPATRVLRDKEIRTISKYVIKIKQYIYIIDSFVVSIEYELNNLNNC